MNTLAGVDALEGANSKLKLSTWVTPEMLTDLNCVITIANASMIDYSQWGTRRLLNKDGEG